MARAAPARRRHLPHAGRLSARALGLLPREARRRRPGRPRRDRAAATDREGRAEGDVHAGEPDRHAPLRRPLRARPDLLDERHDRHAELHPADGGRPRELGDGIRTELRGFGNRRRTAHRLHLRRRPLRGRRRARVVRAHRADARPGWHGQHRAADAGGRAAPARGRRADAVVRRAPDRVGRRARRRPARVERGACPRRGGAGRRRAGLPREARGRLGREGHRGDGHRRHRRLALGGVRGAGRHAPRSARVRPCRADRPRDR